MSWIGIEPRSRGLSMEDVLVRIRTEDVVWIEDLCLHWDWNGGQNTTGKHCGLNQDWNGGQDTTGKHCGLNQDWNRGWITTGKLLSRPGLERRTYHDGETFVSTRDGTEVSSNYKGKYFVRVFNLCKGGILPYKGIGIQYLEKWRREIIM